MPYNYSISLVFTWSDNNTVFFAVSLAEDPILMEERSIYNLQIIKTEMLMRNIDFGLFWVKKLRKSTFRVYYCV